MNPPIETIRLGKQSRDQLIKIKRNTGIANWNIICRWAFCVSLREPTPPPAAKASTENGVEMTWKVFAGDQTQTYEALLNHDHTRRAASGEKLDKSALLHAHLRRGLGYLASGSQIRTIDNFISRWMPSVE